jgi:hypothetical protein
MHVKLNAKISKLQHPGLNLKLSHPLLQALAGIN